MNKFLILLKVGIIEVLFVGVMLVLLFATLNYFNILPISQLWPNYLGFLPQRSFKQSQQLNNAVIQQSNNVTIAPTMVPTASLIQAKQTLTSFLPAILASSLLPQASYDVTLTQDKSKEIFNASWSSQDGRTGLDFTTSQDLKKIISLDLYFERILHVPTPTVDSAQPIVSELFSIIPKGTWGCKNVINDKRLYCENFWQELDAKKGLGFIIISTSSGNRVVFSFCMHSKESNLYNWNSCRAEFSKSGIQD